MRYLLLLIGFMTLASCSSNKVNSDDECEWACRTRVMKYERKAPVGCECLKK